MTASIQKPAAPKLVTVAKADTAAAPAPQSAKAAPERAVDVANFRILPLAGAPKVSADVDPTLGKTGVDAFVLNKLEGAGRFGMMAAAGVRLFTRVVGPIFYGWSAIRNVGMLKKAYADPTIDGNSKTVLTLGTIGTAIGAVGATIAALPLQLFGKLGLTLKRQIVANKVSSVAGGIAGVSYATINMVETLRNPNAKPAERAFAKVGFGLGALGFVTGTTALVLSMTGGLPWLLPVASKIATGAGLLGLGSWVAQMFLGKNEWLNKQLKGTAIA